MEQEHETLTPKEVREILGLGHNAVYAALKRGEIPHLKFGKKILIPRKALERLLECEIPDRPSLTKVEET